MRRGSENERHMKDEKENKNVTFHTVRTGRTGQQRTGDCLGGTEIWKKKKRRELRIQNKIITMEIIMLKRKRYLSP